MKKEAGKNDCRDKNLEDAVGLAGVTLQVTIKNQDFMWDISWWAVEIADIYVNEGWERPEKQKQRLEPMRSRS